MAVAQHRDKKQYTTSDALFVVKSTQNPGSLNRAPFGQDSAEVVGPELGAIVKTSVSGPESSTSMRVRPNRHSDLI